MLSTHPATLRPPCSSYFTDIKEQRDADLLVLATDACIFEDDGFRCGSVSAAFAGPGAVLLRMAAAAGRSDLDAQRAPPRAFCRPFAEKYAADQGAFFEDYVEAHLKLSELGSKFA